MVIPGSPEWLGQQIGQLATTLTAYVVYIIPAVLGVWGLLYGVELARNVIGNMVGRKSG